MKIAVTGASGQLGRDMMEELERRGHQAVGLNHNKLDITDALEVRQVLADIAPDAVIHCAAWTAVDEGEARRDECMAVNSTGSRNVAMACAALDCAMLYPSTDYVFCGIGATPWQPGDTPDPQNVYGLSKYLGELAVLACGKKGCVVRTSWVFGTGGRNFFNTMLELAKTHDRIRVVSDQIGRPTYTRDLARLLADMAERGATGIYHATGSGDYVSWYELATALFKLVGITHIKLAPVATNYYPAPARRPLNSRLDTTKLEDDGYAPLPDWQDALRAYLKEAGVI